MGEAMIWQFQGFNHCHHTVFLNEMCAHAVDFHDLKLRQFKGEKDKVLEQLYFELGDKNEKWVFSLPGSL